ncbi:MAG: T9SS type A sorting domain-containing protein, partial [Bacteroidetes bacterium]|nr:T9SS type A sorting domain-containing protein [Bacteroidota bacterium]
DPNKFFTNAQFENNIIMNVNNTPGIKTFIMARNASLTTQLAPFGCWLGTSETMTTVSQLSVFPNPSATIVTISLPQNWNLGDCFLQIYDVTGNVISTENILNFDNNNYLIATERMANGIYLLSVTNGNGENKRTPIAVIH